MTRLLGLLSAVLCTVCVAFAPSARRPVRTALRACERVEVCLSGRGKYCKRRGSAKVLELFERLAPDGVQIEVVDCLDECTLGPNVRLDGDDRRVQNGIKTAAQVAEILGVPVPDELDADA